MPIRLADNNYGKQRVRLLRLFRQEGRHDVKELTLGVRFTGDFDAAHTKGDNRKILPTDTIKNTVYALARQYPIEAVEDFSTHLIEHFLTYNPHVEQVTVESSEHLWGRLTMGGKPHATTFLRARERRTALVTGTREGNTVNAGIDDLLVMKTAKSGFESFMRDPYTTLRDSRDRILATTIRSHWLYDGDEIEFSPSWHSVRQAILETFAEHDSRSLQHTLYAMGEAVLGSFDRIREIHFSLPNTHYNLVDLSHFGMDNPGEVFLPTDDPHGLIEATVRRD
jgi:urate oxidase